MIAPCKDCDKKGCGAYHTECKQYKAFLNEVEKIRNERHKVSDVNAAIINLHNKTFGKLKYKKGERIISNRRFDEI